jgi:hypothetical protein
MKALILALALIPATAQSQPYAWPQTLKLYNNNNGEVVGTATKWLNKFTLRNVNGDLIGTLIISADGSRTFYDPSGQQVEALPLEVK